MLVKMSLKIVVASHAFDLAATTTQRIEISAFHFACRALDFPVQGKKSFSHAESHQIKHLVLIYTQAGANDARIGPVQIYIGGLLQKISQLFDNSRRNAILGQAL